jgi:hypothetical protein
MHLLHGLPLKVTEVHDIGKEGRNTTLEKTKQTTITWFGYRFSLHPKLVRAPRSRLVPPPKTDPEDL